tara:strand:+ start:595 stop:753 length:159 start_codon:yes stop_codon:yes gene_type:complete
MSKNNVAKVYSPSRQNYEYIQIRFFCKSFLQRSAIILTITAGIAAAARRSNA